MLLIILVISWFQIQNYQTTGSIQGGWEITAESGDFITLIASESYMTVAIYNPGAKSFLRTYGGKYQLSDQQLILKYEFDTQDSLNIGMEQSYKMQVNETSLTLESLVKTTWKNLDHPSASNQLAGCWRITARMGSDGKMSAMTSGPRKTIKMNSATRFQWIAINPETKQFFGTGGGTYTLTDGKYKKHILFFSRDGSRVGSELGFNAEIQNGKWMHSGKSSTGNDVNEIWEKQ